MASHADIYRHCRVGSRRKVQGVRTGRLSNKLLNCPKKNPASAPVLACACSNYFSVVRSKVLWLLKFHNFLHQVNKLRSKNGRGREGKEMQVKEGTLGGGIFLHVFLPSYWRRFASLFCGFINWTRGGLDYSFPGFLSKGYNTEMIIPLFTLRQIIYLSINYSSRNSRTFVSTFIQLFQFHLTTTAKFS